MRKARRILWSSTRGLGWEENLPFPKRMPVRTLKRSCQNGMFGQLPLRGPLPLGGGVPILQPECGCSQLGESYWAVDFQCGQLGRNKDGGQLTKGGQRCRKGHRRGEIVWSQPIGGGKWGNYCREKCGELREIRDHLKREGNGTLEKTTAFTNFR